MVYIIEQTINLSIILQDVIKSNDRKSLRLLNSAFNHEISNHGFVSGLNKEKHYKWKLVKNPLEDTVKGKFIRKNQSYDASNDGLLYIFLMQNGLYYTIDIEIAYLIFLILIVAVSCGDIWGKKKIKEVERDRAYIQIGRGRVVWRNK